MAEEGGDTELSRGRIITQNPAYMDMLRENTDEDHNTPPDNNTPISRKLYVDSPIFSKDDEEKYKYVSENADDFDEDHHKALQKTTSTLEENYDTKPLDGNPIAHQASSNSVDSDTVARQGSTKSSAGPQRAQYVVRSGLSSRTSTLSSRVHSGTKPIAPLRSPLRGLTKEEEDELEQLKLEEAYQAQLKLRIQDAQNKDIVIPKLNLDESDEDDHKLKDSLDIDFRDSLDDPVGKDQPEDTSNGQNDPELQDSLEWGDPPVNPSEPPLNDVVAETEGEPNSPPPQLLHQPVQHMLQPAPPSHPQDRYGQPPPPSHPQDRYGQSLLPSNPQDALL